jgi:hypothetical protein
MAMNPNQFLNGQPYNQNSNQYPTNNYTMGGPVLQDPNQAANAQSGILSSGGYGSNTVSSGNARGSQMPDMKIGQGEMLMRMGAAGVGAANRGDSYIEAMGQSYGDIKDANRQAEADAYNADMINRKAEALAAAKKAEKQETLDIENNQKVGDLRISLNQMQEAKRILQESENVTGKSGGDFWNRLVGSTVGNKEQADRLFLKKLKLDEVMARVAETKGAISNAEMKLFASSAPSDYDDESVWIAWLDRKMQMQEIFMNRILNPNARLTDLNAPLSETMPNMSMPEANAQYEVLEIEDETPDPE